MCSCKCWIWKWIEQTRGLIQTTMTEKKTEKDIEMIEITEEDVDLIDVQLTDDMD